MKLQLQELELKNPKDSLNLAERKVFKALKHTTVVILKQADKGITTVVLNFEDKIKDGETQLDSREACRPLVKRT